MGMITRVWGVRKATPEDIEGLLGDLNGDPRFEEYGGRHNVFPDVENECIQLGAIRDWDREYVRTNLGHLDGGSVEIDLRALDKRIEKIIVDRDF